MAGNTDCFEDAGYKRGSFPFSLLQCVLYSPSTSLDASLLIRGMLVLVAVLKHLIAMTAFGEAMYYRNV